VDNIFVLHALKTGEKFRLTTIILNTRLNIIMHIINYFETFPFYSTIL
jgi:hypothetical protein